MAFGMGDGEIEITLGPTTFTPRETINGRIKIRLPSPLDAREIRVEFYGEVERGSKVERVFRSTQKLGGERTYKDGEVFSFSLSIPEQATPLVAQGTFGAVRDLFSPKPRNWFVHATIDIPMAPDINSRISVYMRH
ncbi:MAG: hypothetical protein NTX79_06625 [Candidatus Micrarchaeota archaeon]|nr:hypothetical protein [Candidatus Micrarchaeota archaeon]